MRTGTRARFCSCRRTCHTPYAASPAVNTAGTMPIARSPRGDHEPRRANAPGRLEPQEVEARCDRPAALITTVPCHDVSPRRVTLPVDQHLHAPASDSVDHEPHRAGTREPVTHFGPGRARGIRPHREGEPRPQLQPVH